MLFLWAGCVTISNDDLKLRRDLDQDGTPNAEDCAPEDPSIAIPEWWEGRVLLEGLEGVTPMWVEGAPPTGPAQQSLAEADAQELEERLRSLGYL